MCPVLALPALLCKRLLQSCCEVLLILERNRASGARCVVLHTEGLGRRRVQVAQSHTLHIESRAQLCREDVLRSCGSRVIKRTA